MNVRRDISGKRVGFMEFSSQASRESSRTAAGRHRQRCAYSVPYASSNSTSLRRSDFRSKFNVPLGVESQGFCVLG